MLAVTANESAGHITETAASQSEGEWQRHGNRDTDVPIQIGTTFELTMLITLLDKSGTSHPQSVYN